MLQAIEVAADSITGYGFDSFYWGEPQLALAANIGVDLFAIMENLLPVVDALSMPCTTLHAIDYLDNVLHSRIFCSTFVRMENIQILQTLLWR